MVAIPTVEILVLSFFTFLIIVGVCAFLGKKVGSPKSFGLMLIRGNFVKLFFSSLLALVVFEIVISSPERKIDPAVLTFFASLGGALIGSLDRTVNNDKKTSKFLSSNPTKQQKQTPAKADHQGDEK